MGFNIEDQYNKIYRYCYFKIHNKESAEDITQETFLRYYKNYNYTTTTAALKCLYTIARNLCIDEQRKPKLDSLNENIDNIAYEYETNNLAEKLAIQSALSKLTHDEQELLLLRYVNDVSVSTISKIYGISRFRIYRKLQAAITKFKAALQKEEYYE